MLAPFAPFLCEELYGQLPKQQSSGPSAAQSVFLSSKVAMPEWKNVGAVEADELA